MKAAFLRLSWGLIIVLLDIRLGFFDILIDAVGYAMVLSALHQLSLFRPAYARALPFAAVLLLLSFNEIFPVMGTVGSGASATVSYLLYGSAVVLLMWLLAETFLSELGAHALNAGQTALAQSAQSARIFYRVISAGTLIYLPFTLNMTASHVSGFPILVSILGLLAQAVFVFICRRAAQALGEPLPTL